MTDDRAWVPRAACANSNLDAFFPVQGGSDREARLICNQCPVKAECLEYALEYRIAYGIWGGVSEKQRRAARSDRAREAQVLREQIVVKANREHGEMVARRTAVTVG